MKSGMTKQLKIKSQFIEAKRYIGETKNYIFTAIILFIVSGFIGYTNRENLSMIDELLKEILSQTTGLNLPEMIFFILQNNLASSFIAIFAGVAFGIFPLFFSIINGTVIGYVLGISQDFLGSSEWWRLLPHGIFELPAIFISIGLGIKLGFTVVKSFFQEYWKNHKAILFIPIIVAAGFTLTLLTNLDSF